MMDKWQSQQAFWQSFGWPAYDENTVFTDEEPAYPHITYQAIGGVMGQDMMLSASLWDKTTSWAGLSQKADEIAAALKGGVVVTLKNGYMWYKMPQSTPYAQRMSSGGDDGVKRIYLSVEAESLTGE